MKDLPYAFDVYQVVIKRTKDRQSAIVADLDTSCRQQFMEVLASHAFQGAIRANGSKYRAFSANRAVSVRRKGCRCRKACSQGYFAPKENASVCMACPIGYWTRFPGATHCEVCLPGKFGVQNRSTPKL